MKTVILVDDSTSVRSLVLSMPVFLTELNCLDGWCFVGGGTRGSFRSYTKYLFPFLCLVNRPSPASPT